MKTEQNNRIKKGILRSLLAVLLLVVGFLLLLQQSTNASAAVPTEPQTMTVKVYEGAMPAFATSIGEITVSYFYEGMAPGEPGQLSFSFAEADLTALNLQKPELVKYSPLAGVSTRYGKFEVSNGRYFLSLSVKWSDFETLLPYIAIKAELGVEVALPEAPAKEGHTFAGWYLDQELTRPYSGEPIYADTQLYPKYDINKFTITFNSNGGSAVDNKTINWNTAVTDLPTSLREGYNFKGWYINGEKYTNQPIKNDAQLVASWEIKIYTVTIYGENGEVLTSLQVPHGTSLATAMKQAKLKYYKAYNLSGELESGTLEITENIALSATEMTFNEKVGAFVGNNVWIFWTLGAGFVLFILTAVILIVKKARG